MSPLRRPTIILIVLLTLGFLYSAFQYSNWPPPAIQIALHSPSLPVYRLAQRPVDPLWATRAESVRQAFLHAHQGYERYAPFPTDGLLPLTNDSIKNLNGWGVTVVDSLDTMLLLGLEDEFNRTLTHVEALNFALPNHAYANFSETVIRYLGGLLSAYALSGEPVLLAKADELGAKLLPAFDTTGGLPAFAINPEKQELRHATGLPPLFAEIASCQMEYKYLAHLTGREDYFIKVDKIMDYIEINQPPGGIWPTDPDTKTGQPVNTHHSIGAHVGSAYEYLLKQYLLSGMTEHRLAKMYMKSMAGVLDNLIYLSHTRNLLYITDTNEHAPTRRFEHLSCFFPGLLALGVATLPDDFMSPKERELHMWAAEGLAHTCWVMYADQPSGLAPEVVLFDGSVDGAAYSASSHTEEKWTVRVQRWEQAGRPGGKPPGVGDTGSPLKDQKYEKLDYSLQTSSFLLRHETLESMIMMYRTTKDAKWRDRGWQIWEAIESKTRTPSGYASVNAVNVVDPPLADSRPSYFLAETVKYAYLLTLDDNPLPADLYVLNTRAHPFPVFSWRGWERQQYGIGKERLE